MHINSMHDREFKVMIKKILAGLEKRIECYSEIINAQVRNNIAEIKGSVNQIRDRLDGMKSRLEEAEE